MTTDHPVPPSPGTAPNTPSGVIDRRGFTAASLGAGFALAVSPVAGATIITDADGITGGERTIATPDGREMTAYQAHPGGPGPYPVVLVVQEIFGVHEHIRDLCRRLAKQGYHAIAPDLYFRQGDPTRVADIPTLISTIVAKVPDAQVMGDLDATLAAVRQSGPGDVTRAAITGFCWGGRITWLYAAHNPALKAAAAWYGKLIGPTDPLHPRNPIDVATTLTVPVLGLYGGKDEGIPVTTAAQMRDALAAAERPSEIVLYDDAPHGFNADYRPSYRAADAIDAWGRMLAWFKANGAA